MSSATYSVVVNVGDGRNEEQFTEKFTVTMDNKTIKELKADWKNARTIAETKVGKPHS